MEALANAMSEQGALQAACSASKREPTLKSKALFPCYLDEGRLVPSHAQARTGGFVRRSGSGKFPSGKNFSPDFAFTSCHRVIHCTVSHGALNNLPSLVVSHDCSAVCEAIDDLSSQVVSQRIFYPE